MKGDASIIGPDDAILVTGATGFIGPRLVTSLLGRGFRNVICFVRSSSDLTRLQSLARLRGHGARVRMVEGNLLSAEDCTTATRDAAIIFQLAPSRGDLSSPDEFSNSAVRTRNPTGAGRRH